MERDLFRNRIGRTPPELCTPADGLLASAILNFRIRLHVVKKNPSDIVTAIVCRDDDPEANLYIDDPDYDFLAEGEVYDRKRGLEIVAMVHGYEFGPIRDVHGRLTGLEGDGTVHR